MVPLASSRLNPDSHYDEKEVEAKASNRRMREREGIGIGVTSPLTISATSSVAIGWSLEGRTESGDSPRTRPPGDVRCGCDNRAAGPGHNANDSLALPGRLRSL